MHRTVRPAGLLLAGITILTGCVATADRASDALAPTRSAIATLRTAIVEVYKSPDCTCCHDWETYLAEHGYQVRSIPTGSIATVKSDAGVPATAWSCHTAFIDGFVVEGHVPVAAIEDLLAQRPDIDGIALPGMPAGSPGMPGTQVEPFAVLAIVDGGTSDFGRY